MLIISLVLSYFKTMVHYSIKINRDVHKNLPFLKKETKVTVPFVSSLLLVVSCCLFLDFDFSGYDGVGVVAFAQKRLFDFAGWVARYVCKDDLARSLVTRQCHAEVIDLCFVGSNGFI